MIQEKVLSRSMRVITEGCTRCGLGKHTDTWAQDPDDGTQGLRQVTYQPDRYTDAVGGAQQSRTDLLVCGYCSAVPLGG